MEICHSTIWKHFESRAPQGCENFFVCKCVFVRACISECVCVCVLCLLRAEPRDISDATTVPVSHIPLKKHVDSDKPPLPALFVSSPTLLLGWTGGDVQPQQTFITHSQVVWFSTSLLIFSLYFTILNHLLPQLTSMRNDEDACQ